MQYRSVTKEEEKEFKELTKSQQKQLILFCLNFKPIKTINTRSSSYGLKHIFERSYNGFYITNNQFKHAMKLCGYRAVTFDYCEPINEFYNISSISMRDLKLLNERIRKNKLLKEYRDF